MMQFGHNDEGAINDNFSAPAGSQGTGDRDSGDRHILTSSTRVVHSFGWYLKKFSPTRAPRGHPLVCSLIPRKNWKDGRSPHSEKHGKCG